MNEEIKSQADINTKNGVDLNVYQCGIQICSPSHGYGPAVRDHYLIHYILEGSGTFVINDKSYKLSKNQGFLIPPNVTTYYEADCKAPWTYMWIGFHGLKAEHFLKKSGLTAKNPVFTHQGTQLQDYLFEMIETDKTSHYSDLKLTGLLFLFISELVKKHPKKPSKNSTSNEIYIKQAIQFIENNYSRPIKIKDIANHLSLNRSYFSNIFTNSLQKSPQQFLIEYRMDKAADLLKSSSLPVNTISHSVGYLDPFNFSKMFKKIKGKSPSQYRSSSTNK